MLFSISANYTAQALRAMGENPNTDRSAAVEKLVSAAGGENDWLLLYDVGWSGRADNN
jgi:hypothetical protein